MQRKKYVEIQDFKRLQLTQLPEGEPSFLYNGACATSSGSDTSCTSHANHTHKANREKTKQKVWRIYTHDDCLYMFFRTQFEIRLRGGARSAAPNEMFE